jgi:hypothetical protein
MREALIRKLLLRLEAMAVRMEYLDTLIREV